MLHVLATLAGGDPFLMVDLAVYVDGARHLTDGTLYDFFSEPLHLPFTYPTFSAIIFTPMTWLPWTRAAGAVAAGLVRRDRADGVRDAAAARPGRAEGAATRCQHVRGIVVTITALGLWLEPVRTTFNYGQINLFLCALLLAGAVAGKEWMAGASVGLAAGIKLTPAITGLYYLLQKRWSAVDLVDRVLRRHRRRRRSPCCRSETWRFFTKLMLDPGRTGPVWSAINQSLRGALARIAGAGPDLGLAGLRGRWRRPRGLGDAGCACGPATGPPGCSRCSSPGC